MIISVIRRFFVVTHALTSRSGDDAGDQARGAPTASPAPAKSSKAAADAKKGAKKRKQKQAKARSKRSAGAKYSTADMILLGVVCICSLWAGYQLLMSSGGLGRFGGSAGGDNGLFPGEGQRVGGGGSGGGGGGAPARTAKHKRSFEIASD